mmetsp:Transcript_393/g.511  ORF Transcript_393/g.511 Transcript_393/m.511 type:complete len:173 (-) Transcript_393:36-554(-)
MSFECTLKDEQLKCRLGVSKRHNAYAVSVSPETTVHTIKWLFWTHSDWMKEVYIFWVYRGKIVQLDATVQQLGWEKHRASINLIFSPRIFTQPVIGSKKTNTLPRFPSLKHCCHQVIQARDTLREKAHKILPEPITRQLETIDYERMFTPTYDQRNPKGQLIDVHFNFSHVD